MACCRPLTVTDVIRCRSCFACFFFSFSFSFFFLSICLCVIFIFCELVLQTRFPAVAAAAKRALARWRLQSIAQHSNERWHSVCCRQEAKKTQCVARVASVVVWATSRSSAETTLTCRLSTTTRHQAPLRPFSALSRTLTTTTIQARTRVSDDNFVAIWLRSSSFRFCDVFFLEL